MHSNPVYVAQIIDNQIHVLSEYQSDKLLIERIDLFFGVWLRDYQRSSVHIERGDLVRSCSGTKHKIQRQKHNKVKSRTRLGKRERQAKDKALNLTHVSDNVVFKRHLLKQSLEGQNAH